MFGRLPRGRVGHDRTTPVEDVHDLRSLAGRHATDLPCVHVLALLPTSITVIISWDSPYVRSDSVAIRNNSSAAVRTVHRSRCGYCSSRPRKSRTIAATSADR